MPATRTDFWVSKIAANKARDQVKETQLAREGWRLAIIWECALKLERDKSLRQLVAFVRSKRSIVEIPSQGIR